MRPTTLKPPMRKPRGKTHVTQTKPPPVGGIDTVNPRALMPPNNAVVLDNFISSEAGLAMREGWYEYATKVGGGIDPIRTIMSFESSPETSLVSPLSVSELFASTDKGIYLIEGGADMTGEAPMLALSTVPNAGVFSFVQFVTEGGNYLIACSETDGAFIYDGLAWTKYSSTGGQGPGTINGADPTKFVYVTSYKKRLMFLTRANSLCWMFPVGQVGGTVTKFDFGPMLKHGGMPLMMVNWTQDSGEGTDDRLMVMGSAGDLAIYEGDDPTSATAFRCVGIWFIGQPPIGRRSITVAGGAPYALTSFGLISLGAIVNGGLENILTSNAEQLRQLRLLQQTLSQDFQTKLYSDGWEIRAIPSKSLLLITRPRTTIDEDVHYVFQLHTSAWSRLLDMPGSTFGTRLNEVYSATPTGRVLRVLDGYTDSKQLDGSGALHIRGRVIPAFDYFGSPDVIKQALMIRPTFLAAGPVSYTVSMNVDFEINTDQLTPIDQDVVGALWNQATWDKSHWAPDFKTSSEWRGVEGLGYALAPSLFVSSQTRCVLASIAYMMMPGGPL